MLVRLFIIQHDCGHGSFFTSQRLANRVGAALGRADADAVPVLAAHPRDAPREFRQPGAPRDSATSTRGRWRSTRTARPWERFKYRVYRHPLALFGVGAVLHFVVRHRLPTLAPAGLDARAPQHHADQRRPAGVRARDERAGRMARVPAGPRPRGAGLVLDRRVALLRAAPVRADVLGARRPMGLRAAPPATAVRTTCSRRCCSG